MFDLMFDVEWLLFIQNFCYKIILHQINFIGFVIIIKQLLTIEALDKMCYRPENTNIDLVKKCIIYEPSHDKTNKMTWAPSEDRSDWTSSQYSQSLRCPREEALSKLPIERTAKTLIRLGGCSG